MEDKYRSDIIMDTHSHTQTYMHINMYISIGIYIHTHIYIYIYICICVCTYIYISLYAHMFLYFYTLLSYIIHIFPYTNIVLAPLQSAHGFGGAGMIVNEVLRPVQPNALREALMCAAFLQPGRGDSTGDLVLRNQ